MLEVKEDERYFGQNDLLYRPSLYMKDWEVNDTVTC